MVTKANTDVELLEDQWSVRFEKMARRTDWNMPSNRSRAARRASARTSASARVARSISSQRGGMHRRRRTIR